MRSLFWLTFTWLLLFSHFLLCYISKSFLFFNLSLLSLDADILLLLFSFNTAFCCCCSSHCSIFFIVSYFFLHYKISFKEALREFWNLEFLFILHLRGEINLKLSGLTNPFYCGYALILATHNINRQTLEPLILFPSFHKIEMVWSIRDFMF